MSNRYKKIIEYYNMLKDEGLVYGRKKPVGNLDALVTDVSYNSLEAKEGTLFICKGANFKRKYLDDAIKSGAVCFVCDKENAQNETINSAEKLIPMIIVKDLRKAISKLSAFYFDRSWDNLKIIGLTGTKGKSTTACMIKAIMDEFLSREIGFSSGIYTYDGNEKLKSKKLTTPETIELHRILDNSVKNNLKYLVMEVSSQGLKYDRVLDLNYEIGCFLNISKDHISAVEHKDMEDYLTSKLKLFKQSKIGLINMDMDKTYLPRIMDEAEKCCEKVIYIKSPEVIEGPGYIDIKTMLKGKIEEFRVNIGGEYNGINAVCAINVCSELGVPVKIMKDALKKLVVPGRMEHYNLDNNVDVIVDCAHNKMSYEGLFKYADEQYPGRKKFFLFGCVGDKAYNRRKEAAEIVDKFSDYAVITERDPGKEPVKQICSEIYSYIKHKERAEIIIDRDEAVKKILDDAIKIDNSIVLLCGCGSDAYVKRGTQLIEFPTDGERVREYIYNYKPLISKIFSRKNRY